MPSVSFLEDTAISNRIQCRLEICVWHEDEVKDVEHFTEKTEKGGGHGDVVLAVRWVRAHLIEVVFALRSEDSLPH